jgi:hypothetical protein
LAARVYRSVDERRIYYRLTPLGEQVAKAEAERHEKIVTLARSKNVLRRAKA